MTKERAAALISMVRQMGDRLSQSVAEVGASESPADELRYRTAVGKVMARMYTEIMAPIFKEHPDIIPPEIGGPPKK